MSDRDDRPSKTRLKREAESLQQLGVELAALPAETLDGLELPEKLRHALDELGRIRAHGALRRQRQYVGKLMRDVDPEPLRAVIEAARRPGLDEARRFKAAEAWRERLMQDEAKELARFAEEFPATDTAGLSEALAGVRAGRAGAGRRVFRLVREAMDAGPDPGPASAGRLRG